MKEPDPLRGACYRLLSGCFYPPERDALRRDATGLVLAEALDAVYPETDAAAHAAALHDALETATDLDLQVDYAALFVGPYGTKAPPYGSVHLEEGRLLMGETTAAAAACYAEAGLSVALREPADHIAVELEYMGYLATRAVDAAARGDGDEVERLAEREGAFLRTHVGAWAPALCDAIAEGASTPFYRALAACLGAFIDAELQRAG